MSKYIMFLFIFAALLGLSEQFGLLKGVVLSLSQLAVIIAVIGAGVFLVEKGTLKK